MEGFLSTGQNFAHPLLIEKIIGFPITLPKPKGSIILNLPVLIDHGICVDLRIKLLLNLFLKIFTACGINLTNFRILPNNPKQKIDCFFSNENLSQPGGLT